MPQYKNRMYRKEWLSERRKLTRAVQALEEGWDLEAQQVTIPTTDDGTPLTLEQMHERIAEIDGKLERYPNPQK